MAEPSVAIGRYDAGVEPPTHEFSAPVRFRGAQRTRSRVLLVLLKAAGVGAFGGFLALTGGLSNAGNLAFLVILFAQWFPPIDLLRLRDFSTWVAEERALLLDGGWLRRARRVPVSEISHAYVGGSGEAIVLVSTRPEDPSPFAVLRSSTHSAAQREAMGRWLVGRVEVRSRTSAALDRSPTPFRTGIPILTSADYARAIVPLALQAVAVLGIAHWLRVSPKFPLGMLGFLALVTLLAGRSRRRTFEDDAIRWRRWPFGRERRLATAEISHVEESASGALSLIGKAQPPRPLGPRLALVSMSDGDAENVRRWIAARFAVNGPGGDRVPWAERTA